MQSKMKVMREAHRAAIEKLLTPEQKKWLDENAPKMEAPQKTEAVPAKSK
jgi:Spy/CpxP family protein refolding chaperone